jgi:hypothetical protein
MILHRCEKGIGGGQKYMKMIRREINPAQVSRAEKMARQWMKEHEKN